MKTRPLPQRWLRRVLPVTLGLLVSAGAPAAIYKWVDENGVTQYTQTPPPADIEAEEMDPDTRLPSSEQAPHERLQDLQEGLQQRREQRRERAQEEQEEQQEQAQRQQRCEQARTRLASLQRPRVNFVAEDGTRQRSTEEERQRELAKAREYIQKNCN